MSADSVRIKGTDAPVAAYELLSVGRRASPKQPRADEIPIRQVANGNWLP